MDKVNMSEQQPKKQSGVLQFKRIVLGKATGIVIAFYDSYGFIFTERFGPVFVHTSKLPEGCERLELGQYVKIRVCLGKRGRYADYVKICAEQWHSIPDDELNPSVFTVQFIASTIAYCIDEKQDVPFSRIYHLVEHLGIKPSWRILEDALQIESQGGMPTSDSSRRRTIGGVFFFLAKNQVDRENLKRIFRKNVEIVPLIRLDAQESPPKQAQTVPPPTKTITWGSRGESVGLAHSDVGQAKTVKATIIGRPDSIVERGNMIMLMLSHQKPFPSLSKDLPIPEEIPRTTYVVYVTAKQWSGVATAIQNLEDALIIEGHQMWDAEYEAISVYALSITTKLQQQAKHTNPLASTTTS